MKQTQRRLKSITFTIIYSTELLYKQIFITIIGVFDCTTPLLECSDSIFIESSQYYITLSVL